MTMKILRTLVATVAFGLALSACAQHAARDPAVDEKVAPGATSR